MRGKRGKLLGGKPPRRGIRGLREGNSRGLAPNTVELIKVSVIGLFVLGGVAGFAWSSYLQLDAGILRQRAEAVQREDWVPLASLPPHVPNAFVMVVDPAFLGGRTLRKGDNGTTLARELVRQVHALPASIGGEARELVMAPILEHQTTKRGLLELYMNRIDMGRDRGEPIFGIYHAAREYFGIEPQELTISQAATLAGMLLHPRILDPQASIGAVGARRNEVLSAMVRAGLIGTAEHDAALREPLGFQPGIRDMPMTRPADWLRPPPVIRLPEEARPRPDTVQAS